MNRLARHADAADRARRRRHPGLDREFWIEARSQDAIPFLTALARGRGADAAAARLVLEHVGEPLVRVDLADDLRDLFSLAKPSEKDENE